MKKNILLISVLGVNSLIAQTIPSGETVTNYVSEVETSAEYSDTYVENNTQVVEEIKTKLNDKYASDENYSKTVNNSEQTLEESEWLNASIPYDCTPWSATGLDETRTCKVKQIKSSKAFTKSNDYDHVSDIQIAVQERVVDSQQLRSDLAPTDRFLIGYNKDLTQVGSGGDSGSAGGNTGEERKSGEITATITAPAQVTVGDTFNLNWTSTNADYCDLDVLSGENNGTEATKQFQFHTDQTFNVNLTCYNLDSEFTVAKSVVIAKRQCASKSYYKYYYSKYYGRLQYYGRGYTGVLQEGESKTVTEAQSLNYCDSSYYYYSGRRYTTVHKTRTVRHVLSCEAGGVWYVSSYNSYCDNYRSYSYNTKTRL